MLNKSLNSPQFIKKLYTVISCIGKPMTVQERQRQKLKLKERNSRRSREINQSTYLH